MANELTQKDLDEILTFTIALARKAGALMLEGSKAILSSHDVSEKKNAVDLVTEYDVRVEELIRSEIEQAYPSFAFIGEESYAAGKRPELTDAPTYCVDPIDGTTNFVHGFPHACVSLGFLYKKEPSIGVVFNPFLDQMYSAMKGHGAYLNQSTRLPAHPLAPFPSLQTALIGMEWGSDRSASTMGKKTRSFTQVAGDPTGGVRGGKMAHGFRSLGSAALNYCAVAAGQLDMYWEIGCYPWDIAAGVVIAREGGGQVFGDKASALEGKVFTSDMIWGRKYLVIRGVADTEEKGSETQKRIVKGFYECVEEWEQS
ncbi:inositol monophosphatase [Dacryopinax primogenitus]|uniref:Inositol-1-monophosphatase n=1 Tax=Dacryopinax primogenitus (strain DJM 731) TaxID=1858805 RepID=M5G341_DACPD|nr:inositol monophosphatase [Dacryopinax primogenitus]EJU02640.1 inositol monophosphatase [Dacryopinax primogenitus]